MKRTLVKSLLLVLLFAAPALFAQTKISLDVTKAQTKINKEIYGQFAEHLGNCIYGGFYVGEDSKIPNTHGMRNDIINALKEISIPVLRWPGGCFADTYHWKDGIGPKKDRPKMMNVHWGKTVEDNSFGTHEFMELCELIGAQPYISANVGSGTVKEMQDWVEYLTSDGDVPMAKLRKENGREKAWKVKYWGIGNESWGCGGEMTSEYYSNLYKQFASFCFNYGDNKLFRIASGANSFDYEWTETLMKNISTWQMPGLSLHFYSVQNWSKKGSATEFDINSWYNQLSFASQMEELVAKHSAIMDKYDKEKRVGLMVDEWGTWWDVEKGTNPGFLFQQSSLRDAMTAGMNLNIFNNHADRIKMAAIAQAINVLQAMILTKDEKMVLTPTYYVFKLYKVHQDANLIPIQLNEVPVYNKYNEKLPLVNASASVNKEGEINITICNIDAENGHAVQLDINGAEAKSIEGKIITADKINSFNDFGKKEEVNIKPFNGFKNNGGSVEVNMPSKSIVLITIKK
jgi:alpha-L-arabinofuranosidase